MSRNTKIAQKSFLTGVAAAALLASGCYVYTDAPPPPSYVDYCPAGCTDGCGAGSCYGSPSDGSPFYGDLSLGWAFEDAGSCYTAGVAEIQITVEGIDTADGDWVALPCGSSGATMFGFEEGWYWVRIEGRDAAGCLHYETELEVEVLAGMMADLGVVVLDALQPTAPPPPPPPPVIEPAALGIDWAFRYPSADATYDCEYAGVEWMEVSVYDDWGELYYGETVGCTEGPITVDNFDPGRFDVELRGIGLYQGEYIELYSSPLVVTDLYDGSLTDLGVIDLDRNELQFGDFMVDWSFDGYSCAAQGVTDVTVRIIRSDTQIIDDEFTVACEDSAQLRATFVPGDYEVEISTVDVYGDCWYGLAMVDLIPDTMLSVDLWAELVSCY